MRMPVRSERDAFRLVYGFVVAIGLSIALGAVTAPIWGGVLFVVIALGALVVDFLTTDPEHVSTLRLAAAEPHPEAPRDAWRILVIANESLSGDEVKQETLKRSKLRPELMVVAPVLVTRTHFVTTDVDIEMEDARERLRETLLWAKRQGFQATGHIGDPIHPMLAIEDEIRRFGADEVIVATHPLEHANWFEAGILEQIRRELDVPVTQVVIDR